MNEDEKELLRASDLTNDKLKGISGGMELLEMHRAAPRDTKRWAKASYWSEEQFVECLRTESDHRSHPEFLEAAIAFTHEIWYAY